MLRSLCLLLPLLNPDKKSKYDYINSSPPNKQTDLVKDDELYGDISALLSRLESVVPPMSEPFLKDAETAPPSYDELRLAEEIHMEDQVYTNNQINRSVVMKGRYDIRTCKDDEEDNPNTYARLQFIKTDLFHDYCSIE